MPPSGAQPQTVYNLEEIGNLYTLSAPPTCLTASPGPKLCTILKKLATCTHFLLPFHASKRVPAPKLCTILKKPAICTHFRPLQHASQRVPAPKLCTILKKSAICTHFRPLHASLSSQLPFTHPSPAASHTDLPSLETIIDK